MRVATVSGIITLTQALALWKRARRDRWGLGWVPELAMEQWKGPAHWTARAEMATVPFTSARLSICDPSGVLDGCSSRAFVTPLTCVRGISPPFGRALVPPPHSLRPAARSLTLKAAQLANVPCTSEPRASNPFALDNDNVVDTTTSRERNVGLTNRVIAGMLLHQVRGTAHPPLPPCKFCFTTSFLFTPAAPAPHARRTTALKRP